MSLFVVALMAMVMMTAGCKTLGGGCGHKKYVKCLKCRAEYEAKESAKKAVKCKKCGTLKAACKCAPAKCTKCKGACKCPPAKADAKCTKCKGECKCKK